MLFFMIQYVYNNALYAFTKLLLFQIIFEIKANF